MDNACKQKHWNGSLQKEKLNKLNNKSSAGIKGLILEFWNCILKYPELWENFFLALLFVECTYTFWIISVFLNIQKNHNRDDDVLCYMETSGKDIYSLYK